MPKLTVSEILLAAGKDFDGLRNYELECSCTWDNLAPCDGMQPDCYLAEIEREWSPDFDKPEPPCEPTERESGLAQTRWETWRKI